MSSHNKVCVFSGCLGCKRLCVVFIIWIVWILVCCNEVKAKTKTIVTHTETTDPQSNGFWARKTTWKARWVKYWRPKAIYVPIWKKVWTPTIENEYVPLPNAPTGWGEPTDQHSNEVA